MKDIAPIADALENSSAMQALAELARLQAENEAMRAELAAHIAWGRDAYRVIELANIVMPPLELHEWDEMCRKEGIAPMLLTRAPEAVRQAVTNAGGGEE